MSLHPKVQNMAIAGAVTVILVWLALLGGIVVPPEVASAVTLLIGVAAGWLTKSP